MMIIVEFAIDLVIYCAVKRVQQYFTWSALNRHLLMCLPKIGNVIYVKLIK